MQVKGVHIGDRGNTQSSSNGWNDIAKRKQDSFEDQKAFEEELQGVHGQLQELDNAQRKQPKLNNNSNSIFNN